MSLYDLGLTDCGQASVSKASIRRRQTDSASNDTILLLHAALISPPVDRTGELEPSPAAVN